MQKIWVSEEMPQRELVLLHLQRNETITPLEALLLYGCFRLAARIHELRKAGWQISTEGDKHAVYRLEAKDE